MSEPSAKKRKGNPAVKTRRPTKKQRHQPAAPRDKSNSTDPLNLVPDEVPFVLECPTRKLSKKGKDGEETDDVFGPAEENGGYAKLNIKYAIRPGKTWRDLKTFRNFSIQEQKFSTGTLVYINKHVPPPEPPDMDASDAEILAFDKKNLWVGQVLEVKASSSSEVWLRVFWLYWPEELPRGRQKYHGDQELIMSNHMELVDAKAVTGRAEINHWDEKDEDQDVGERFWRQFYDVQNKDVKGGGLSAIRRHCVCNEYYNPDKTMLKCPGPKCGIWNHQECLEQAIWKNIHRRLVNDQKLVDAESKLSPASKFAQREQGEEAESLKSDHEKLQEKGAEARSSTNVLKKSSLWKKLLKVDVSAGEKGVGGAFATITDGRGHVPKVWTESIECLKCGASIK